jgi:hypothetical protein
MKRNSFLTIFIFISFFFFRRFFIFARETPRVYFYLFFSFSFDDDFDDWQYKIRLAIIPVFIRLLCSNSVTIPLTCLFFHHLIVFFLFFFFFIFVEKSCFYFISFLMPFILSRLERRNRSVNYGIVAIHFQMLNENKKK